MKQNESTKGITLIALIITIIVLLILAGTAITIGLNGGDLFGHAENAKSKWDESVAREETGLKGYLAELDNISPSTVTVSENLPTGWNKNQLSKVATAGERTVPIPAGFTVSGNSEENTISGGLVVYRIDNKTEQEISAINWDDEEVLEELKKAYDQFVWIPVDDINSMIMCKDNNKNNDGTVCNLVRQADDSLKCMTHHAEDDGTELCGRLYGVNPTYKTVEGQDIYETKMDFTKRDQIWEVTKSDETTTYGHREPDTTPDATRGDASSSGIAGIINILGLDEVASSYRTIEEDWEDKLTSNFENMAKSVAKYGGFYIGRYEAGYTTSEIPETYTSVKGQTVLIASRSSVNMWYGLYKHLNTTMGGTTSTMIWGCQYDQVIKFIGKEAQIGHPNKYLWSSKAIGTTSGYEPADNTKPLDIMKNIYDLEGNFLETTAQANTTQRRVSRGSYCYATANNSFRTASFKGQSYSNSTDSFIGSRSALHITI